MGRLIKGNSLNQHAFLYANYTSIKSLKEDTKIILQTSRPYWDLLAFYSYVSFHLLSSFIPVRDWSGILYHIHFEVMRPIRHCGLICTVWSSFLSSRFSAYCSRLPRVFFFFISTLIINQRCAKLSKWSRVGCESATLTNAISVQLPANHSYGYCIKK